MKKTNYQLRKALIKCHENLLRSYSIKDSENHYEKRSTKIVPPTYFAS